MFRMILAIALALPAVTDATHAVPREPASNASTSIAVRPPLRSRAQVDAWLQRMRGEPTPLDALTPPARRRFLDTLQFGPHGLATMNPDDLRMELSPAQVRAVLALFGDAADAEAIHPRRKDGSPPLPPGSSAGVEAAFDALFRRVILARDPDPEAPTVLYADRFAPLLRTDRLRRLTLRDLLLVQRATALLARVSPRTAYVDDAIAVADELDRRGSAVARDYAGALESLLRLQRFDAARTLAAKHALLGLPPLPAFADRLGPGDHGPTVWRFDAAGRTLERRRFDLAGTRILVLAGCHFSGDAARDIAKDPELGPLFAAHAQWLFLPPGEEDLQAAVDWNRRFPHAPVQLIHAKSEWSLLPDDWPMPTFLFVADGRVVERITGWSRDPHGGRQALLDTARRRGLLPPQ